MAQKYTQLNNLKYLAILLLGLACIFINRCYEMRQVGFDSQQWRDEKSITSGLRWKMKDSLQSTLRSERLNRSQVVTLLGLPPGLTEVNSHLAIAYQYPLGKKQGIIPLLCNSYYILIYFENDCVSRVGIYVD
jgi:hypothetical protein